MRNWGKWYSFLLVGLALLLLSFNMGCGQSEAYQEGYEAGYEADYKTGYEAGYKTGYEAGYEAGYKASLDQSGADTVPPPSIEPEQIPKVEPPKADLPGAISWDKAISHVGERATVYGPVAGTFYGSSVKGRPTFLNIGEDHPSKKRFTVVIWGQNRGNFPQPPESYYRGKTISVTGLITEYEGIAQIEVTDPSQIQEQ